MATPDPPDTQDIVSLLRSGAAPAEIRQFAARGLLPLDREDQIRGVLSVVPDEDPEIAREARETLSRTAPDEIARFLQNAAPTGLELDTIARHAEDSFVLEQVIRHRNVADETLEFLARTVVGAPQEALIVNQVRLLRQPSLIDSMFENPGLTIDGRRRLNEIREEFFEKERRRQAERLRLEVEAEEAAAAAAAAEAGETKEGAAAGESAAAPEADESLTAGAAHRRIAVLTVSEKIDLAYKGSKEERRVLIGDSNRLVGLAVLKARGLTIQEVEGFASMRNLDEEIFRRIAENRDWIRKQAVIGAMVRNPRAPLSVTLPLVKFMGLRDLRSLSRDTNLPEGIRLTARKMMTEKRR